MGLATPASSVDTVCIVTEHPLQPTETFIRAHVDGLPCRTVLLHGRRPMLGGRPAPALVARLAASRLLSPGDATVTGAYVRAFRHLRPDVVLAEYGPAGVMVQEACRSLHLPLVVHFHGYDASLRDVLHRYAHGYRTLFEGAAAVVAVSLDMHARLVALGAAASKVHVNPYGVDVDAFDGGNPAAAPPVFLAAGRLVEKKAPLATIGAFAAVHRIHPQARLRMIGDGPLRQACERAVASLGLADAVSMLGAQPHARVAEEMRCARAFVQHSVEASSGDREGTPVAIVEAGATGLPVVATRHGGIPDVVIDGETGWLVDEGDVAGMAGAMARLVTDPALAGRLGRAARRRVTAHFAMAERMAALWAILGASVAVSGRPEGPRG